MQGVTSIDFLSEQEFESLCGRYESQFKVKKLSQHPGQTTQSISYEVYRQFRSLAYGRIDLVRHVTGRVDVSYEYFTTIPLWRAGIGLVVLVLAMLAMNRRSMERMWDMLYFFPVPFVWMYLSYWLFKTQVNYSISQLLEERNYYMPTFRKDNLEGGMEVCPACGDVTGGARKCPGCGLNLS